MSKSLYPRIKADGPSVPGTPEESDNVIIRIKSADASAGNVFTVSVAGMLVMGEAVAVPIIKCKSVKSILPNAFAKGPVGKFSPPGINPDRTELYAFRSTVVPFWPVQFARISIRSPADNK